METWEKRALEGVGVAVGCMDPGESAGPWWGARGSGLSLGNSFRGANDLFARVLCSTRGSVGGALEGTGAWSVERRRG